MVIKNQLVVEILSVLRQTISNIVIKALLCLLALFSIYLSLVFISNCTLLKVFILKSALITLANTIPLEADSLVLVV